jgi:hypothetical protein
MKISVHGYGYSMMWGHLTKEEIDEAHLDPNKTRLVADKILEVVLQLHFNDLGPLTVEGDFTNSREDQIALERDDKYLCVVPYAYDKKVDVEKIFDDIEKIREYVYERIPMIHELEYILSGEWKKEIKE